MVREKYVFNPPPTKIHWIYQKYFEEFHQSMKNDVPEIEFYSEFDYNFFMAKFETESSENHLLILDDALQVSVK